MMNSILQIDSINISPCCPVQTPGIRTITSPTNCHLIDASTSTYVPSSTNNNIDIVPVKYQLIDTKIPCANTNTNNIHEISCVSNNCNITSNKSTQ